jgi:predicted RNA-binding protein YlxR (DUF448 family)
LRIALASERGSPSPRAVLDRDGTMPGRGAYLCREPLLGGPVRECVEHARRNRGLARTLRAAVRIDGELIESVGR